jgi:hypothetical protein
MPTVAQHAKKTQKFLCFKTLNWPLATSYTVPVPVIHMYAYLNVQVPVPQTLLTKCPSLSKIAKKNNFQLNF